MSLIFPDCPSRMYSKSYMDRVIAEVEEFDAEKWIAEFEEVTKDAERVQRELLEKILTQNVETEYLKKHGLKAGCFDPASFKECVPVVTYTDIQPYIDRIADGDTSSILTSKRVPSFVLSSGTSNGKNKLVPYLEEKMDACLVSKLTSYAYRNREYPIDESKKALMFVYTSPATKTKGGLDARFGSSVYYSDRKAKLGSRVDPCSPVEVRCASDIQQATYCNLLCGLIYCDQVQFICSAFAHSTVLAFDMFLETWEELCSDIRVGMLSTRITDPSLREVVSRLIKQDLELSDTIHNICVELRDSSWQGLIGRLFPSAKYVLAIMTGTAVKYVGRLRVYAGELPLISDEYVCSEGRIGTNINPRVLPELTSYVVLPNVGYFEFLPVQVRKQQYEDNIEVRPLGLTQVKVGQEYEVVISNFLGLYRYKLGDVVKITGFHNSTPQLQYICRANVILSINTEKTSEKDLQEAVEEASKHLAKDKIKVVEYTSYADVSPRQEHYVIFWELDGDCSDNVLTKCCNSLEKAIPDVIYGRERKRGIIKPLELRVVRKGTFLKILEQTASNGAGSTTQFKMPKCLKNENFIRLFNDNVTSIDFSTAYD
ncbi:jasmonoyl--L-amino acid synthetase JAR4-like [Silene latifolia]|uniref:jasmonoyl--L-amino acid synthetase JAR4-like n=1 Tax=Silene latifolia TaxID=37657 RepID=UPI003D7739A6